MEVSFQKGYLFTWKNSIGASGYELCYSRKQSGGYKALGITTNTFYTIKKLKPGYAYYFRVRPYINVNGKKVYGEFSNTMMILLSYREI
jgi:hypothetical protein